MSGATVRDDLLARVLAPDPPPFALLHRGGDRVDVLVGAVSEVASLREVELADHTGHQVLLLVPYRQLAERGYAVVDDGAPLLALRVDEQDVVSLDDVLARLPAEPVALSGGEFEPDDATYADTVRRVIDEEIGAGVGANFVIRRTYRTRIADYRTAHALTFFRRLCEQESGAYWTFIAHTGRTAFVGATPERQVSLRGGVAAMNPISGTYRYPPTGPTVAGALEFLGDGKESDELFMVVDEELKMMARLCPDRVRVLGPRLKRMARLAHTEYHIEGRTDRDVRDVLAETMFAPTVTGSPVESACRVISRYESTGRGYYSGVAALIGRDADGPTLDSAILIRTAEIAEDGAVRVGVGATLVRHSDPASEAAETRTKVAGLLGALDGTAAWHDHPDVTAALVRRNDGLARFWLTGDRPATRFAGLRVLVIDAEDTFTAMIAHQLRALGLLVEVRRFDEEHRWDGHDLVVLGPGPGDPTDAADPRIAHLRAAATGLLEGRLPFLAVCLSHQVLSGVLGLRLARCPVTLQGTRREIDLFGARETVGFYNSFAARSDADELRHPRFGRVEISRDADTGVVHALRGGWFSSMQFHAESVLTEDGPRILADRIGEVVAFHPTVEDADAA
ncbi:anthranilate synthase family protein [Actinokineospora fastidiosa]|uniref:anthranilate synthase n=1 Tax=Actinokineospora fastidiosa TaxID=1816 RepID=A0A918GSV0_9PSEU|nr:anthranilate synthase family protein [Actinokineospora fastidiosa]GGS56230.1 phenazine-specific anthranilate synthase component I [Actinokineospora fastidiosa]